MGFEVFQKGSAPIVGVPSVTIQKRGLFSLNHAASELIGHPDAVTFLWDSNNRLIAIRPAEPEDPNAYPAREQTVRKPRPNGQRGTVLIAGSMFTKYIGADTAVARRWVPRVQDGMLIVDLSEDGQVVIANRNRGQEVTPSNDDAKTDTETSS